MTNATVATPRAPMWRGSCRTGAGRERSHCELVAVAPLNGSCGPPVPTTPVARSSTAAQRLPPKISADRPLRRAAPVSPTVH
jgi:hypothetical protein